MFTSLPRRAEIIGQAAIAAMALAMSFSCGKSSAAPTSPAASPKALWFATTTPASDQAPAANNCDTPASCWTACEAGDVNGCTRFGDWIYLDEPARAEELWLDSCIRRDAHACLRMMAATAEDPRVADGYARHACAYGIFGACELYGTITALRAASAADPNERPGLARDAAATFEHACDNGSWQACGEAATLHQSKDVASPPAVVSALRKKTLDLALRDCDEGNHVACLTLGISFESAGNTESAKVAYAKGCSHAREQVASTGHFYLDTQKAVCRRATELGVATVQPPGTAPGTSSRPRRSSTPGLVPPTVFKGVRVSGEAKILPSELVEKAMRERGQPHLWVKVKMCLSKSGLVTALELLLSSEHPAYDLRVLESMRAWRYRPYVADGKPIPVCTPIDFVYR